MTDLKISAGMTALLLGVLGFALILGAGLMRGLGDGAMLPVGIGVLMRLASLVLGIIAVIRPDDGRGYGAGAVLIFLVTTVLMMGR